MDKQSIVINGKILRSTTIRYALLSEKQVTVLLNILVVLFSFQGANFVGVARFGDFINISCCRFKVNSFFEKVFCFLSLITSELFATKLTLSCIIYIVNVYFTLSF